MPGGAGQLHEVRKLADERATLECEFPVAELRDMPREFCAGNARAQLSMRFGHEHGWATVRVRLRARLQLTCQRCMGSLPMEIDQRSSLVLIEFEDAADRVPAGAETFLAPEGRLEVRALVREELLLALPLVPRHAQARQCAPAAASDARFGTPASRPFAELRALMKHSAQRRRR